MCVSCAVFQLVCVCVKVFTHSLRSCVCVCASLSLLAHVCSCMYGNLRPGGLAGRGNNVDLEAQTTVSDEDKFTPISWQLLMLVSAEFLLFGTVVVPLLSNDGWGMSVSSFWESYSWIAAGTCLPYIFLTLPVAVGYTWFIQKWPWNAVVWAGIVVSLASVCHIASVATDPRGVFVGLCSIATMLFCFSILRMFDKISFAKSGISFVVAFVWVAAFFLPVYFVSALGPHSSLGGALATLICSVCVIAEFRLIENQTSIVSPSEPPKQFARSTSSLPDCGIYVQDPFTLAIWINCASWRFIFQSVILFEKVFLQGLLAVIIGVQWAWKRTLSCFARRVEPKWLTPTIVGKVINVAATATS